MPAMRRWRDHRTDIVHGFDPLQHEGKRERNFYVVMFCGERLVLKTSRGSGIAYFTRVPTRRNLTHELPSVKTQLTCIGCLAESGC